MELGIRYFCSVCSFKSANLIFISRDDAQVLEASLHALISWAAIQLCTSGPGIRHPKEAVVCV